MSGVCPSLARVTRPLTSPSRLKLWPSQSHPHRSHDPPHANRLPTHQQCMHNTTSRSCFRAGLNRCLFFLFSPKFVCSTPRPQQPTCLPAHPYAPELEAPTPLRALTNIPLHTRHRITPSQSRSRRHLYATLAPLCTPVPKPRTCTTHARPVEVSVFVGARTGESTFCYFYFYFFFAFLFFFSPVRLRTLSTHIRTLSSRAPTLAWPEDKTAVPLQGLNDSNYLHPHRVHPSPMSHPRSQRTASSRHTTDYPL